MKETAFFFDSHGFNLFSVIHGPGAEAGDPSDIGVLVCEPFGEEKLWSHRVFVGLARSLARRSIVTMRFDCMGHGDSEGEHEDSTIETRLRDIESALGVFRRRTGVRRVGLLGLRFGGTLAAVAASRLADVDFLVLWEPAIDLRKYLYEILRSNLATQLATYKKILVTRDQLIEGLAEGKHINVDGYLISREFYEEAVRIDLSSADVLPRKPVFVVNIANAESKKRESESIRLYFDALSGLNPANRYSVIEEQSFWKELNVYCENAGRLFDETADFIASVSGTPGP